ncbi:MAG: aminoacyl-tRNA hydrolase [Desulfobacteraceae bacterium]|nr:aminoacyl-tRNA hydrolase [Desulfobacteraceae bacterium]
MIHINETLVIPEGELTFTASGAGGPGGQHVNKTSTRITLWFDVQNSPSLTAEQKARIAENLHTRINKNGILRISAQRHRSQAANRQQTVEKFAELIEQALEEPAKRKKTRVPRRAKKRRLEEKKHRGRKKQFRSKIAPGEDE